MQPSTISSRREQSDYSSPPPQPRQSSTTLPSTAIPFAGSRPSSTPTPCGCCKCLRGGLGPIVIISLLVLAQCFFAGPFVWIMIDSDVHLNMALQLAAGLAFELFWLATVVCFVHALSAPPACVPPSYRLSDSDMSRLRQLQSERLHFSYQKHAFLAVEQLLSRKAISAAPLQRVLLGLSRGQRNGLNALDATHYLVVYRICERCSLLQPDRTHHCRESDRCHLRMDHYCAVLNRCIDANNYKSFVLFLLYLSLMLTVGLLFACAYIALVIVAGRFASVSWHHVLLLIFAASVFGVSQSVVGTLCFHLRLIRDNTTTHEQFRSPCFDFGFQSDAWSFGSFCGNAKAMLGKELCLWPLPFSSPSTSRCVFPKGVAWNSPRRDSYWTKPDAIVHDMTGWQVDALDDFPLFYYKANDNAGGDRKEAEIAHFKEVYRRRHLEAIASPFFMAGIHPPAASSSSGIVVLRPSNSGIATLQAAVSISSSDALDYGAAAQNDNGDAARFTEISDGSVDRQRMQSLS